MVEDINKGAGGCDSSGDSGSGSNNEAALSCGDSSSGSGDKVALTTTELESAQRLSDEVTAEFFNDRDELDDFGEVASDFDWSG